MKRWFIHSNSASWIDFVMVTCLLCHRKISSPLISPTPGDILPINLTCMLLVCERKLVTFMLIGSNHCNYRYFSSLSCYLLLSHDPSEFLRNRWDTSRSLLKLIMKPLSMAWNLCFKKDTCVSWLFCKRQFFLPVYLSQNRRKDSCWYSHMAEVK